MYQLNKGAAAGTWVVTLMNNHGVDKTQSGISRVDRSKFVDVVLHTDLPVKSAIEYTQSRTLTLSKTTKGTPAVVTSTVSLRVSVGDVNVVAFA